MDDKRRIGFVGDELNSEELRGWKGWHCRSWEEAAASEEGMRGSRVYVQRTKSTVLRKSLTGADMQGRTNVAKERKSGGKVHAGHCGAYWAGRIGCGKAAASVTRDATAHTTWDNSNVRRMKWLCETDDMKLRCWITRTKILEKPTGRVICG